MRGVTLGFLLTVWGCTALPDGSVDAPDQLGPYAVGHTSFTAVDEYRDGRSLEVDVWYPSDDVGDAETLSYPLAAGVGLDSEVAYIEPEATGDTGRTLLVFSHGYGGIRTQSVELMEALASHGFVVASPEHTGNSQASPDDPFDVAAANRVPDVSFVIDTMFARSEAEADLFSGLLDTSAVGVVGHSFGGMTSLGVAAGWAGASPDPRVAAIAPISAVVRGDMQQDDRDSANAGFTDAQLASVDVPVLLLGGTADVDVPIENNAIAFAELTAAPAVYQVDVLGASHTHFASICPIAEMLIELGIGVDTWPLIGAEALLGPYEESCAEDVLPIEDATRLMNLYVVSFFQRHLRGVEGYGAYLTGRYAKQEPLVVWDAR